MYHCLTFTKNVLNPNDIPTRLNVPKRWHPSLAALMRAACEQLFSSMKLTKTKLRVQLIDEHLQDVMLLFLSSELQKTFKKTTNITLLSVFLLVSINVCCILWCWYELLKSAVNSIKIS